MKCRRCGGEVVFQTGSGMIGSDSPPGHFFFLTIVLASLGALAWLIAPAVRAFIASGGSWRTLAAIPFFFCAFVGGPGALYAAIVTVVTWRNFSADPESRACAACSVPARVWPWSF